MRLLPEFPVTVLRLIAVRHRSTKESCVANERVKTAAYAAFWKRASLNKMTAQEQMKKMLDELMGTQRDGE